MSSNIKFYFSSINSLNTLRLVRIPLIFTAIADSFAGYILTAPMHMRFSNYIELFGLALVSAFLYSAGMVFNDIVDIERDKSLYPNRVLPSAKLSRQSAIMLGILLVVPVLIVSVLLSLNTVTMVLVIIILIFIYNGFLKEFRLLGSLNMGLIRFSNFVLGMTIGFKYESFDYNLLFYPYLLFLYVAILTFVKTLEEKESKKELFIFLILLLAMTVLGINAFIEKSVLGIVCSIFLSGVLLFEGMSVLNRFSKENVDKIITLSVIGIIPFNSAILLGNGYYFAGLFLLVFLIPSIILSKVISYE